MKKTNRMILTVMIIAMFLLGIGYAAIENISLNITGDITADVNSANFIVKFTEVVNVSQNLATVSIVDDTHAKIDAGGLTNQYQSVSATYAIKNESPGLSADIGILTQNYNTEYFAVKTELGKTSLLEGESTTVKVTVTLKKAPVPTNITRTVDIELINAVVQPGQEGTGGIQPPIIPDSIPMYGDKVLVSTDQKYFTFAINEDGTAEITGIKDEYAEYSYYIKNGSALGEEYKLACAINDNGTYITDIVIPYEYVDGDRTYVVTKIADYAFAPQDRHGWAYNYEEKEKMFTSFTLPNTITTIGNYAFCSNYKIAKIENLKNVTTIGRDAFSGCINISEITIPENVTSIGNGAFGYWTAAQTIYCEFYEKPAGWNNYWSGGSAKIVWLQKDYYGDASLQPTDQKYFTFTVDEATQTATITGIKDEYAEYSYYTLSGTTYYDHSLKCVINDNGTYITDVVIPYEYVYGGKTYKVTQIGDGAFGADTNYGWYNNFEQKQYMFTSFTLPDTIINIGTNAFAGNLKLARIEGLTNVATIGSYAFAGCTSLNDIVIPEKVTTIGSYAFGYCSSLFVVTIDSATVARGLTTESSQGCLAKNAGVVYVKEGLEIGEYVTGKLRLVTSMKPGYNQYAHI